MFFFDFCLHKKKYFFLEKVDPINFQVDKMIIQELSFVEEAELVPIQALQGMCCFGHKSNSMVAKIYIQIPRCVYNNSTQSCPCNSMFVDSTLTVANVCAMPRHKVVEANCIKVIDTSSRKPIIRPK